MVAVRAGLNQRGLHALGDDLATPGFLLAVEPAREEVVDHLPEAAELALTLGSDDDEMRVRPHEAVGPNEDAVATGILANEIEKEALGGVELKDVRSVMAAPSAMVGGTEIDEKPTRNARHAAWNANGMPAAWLAILKPASGCSNKNGSLSDPVA